MKKEQFTNDLKLIEEGGTVPFIARYRKEVTGGLDEDQIRAVYQEWEYGQKLAQRKEDVMRLIEEKGKLTEEIKNIYGVIDRTYFENEKVKIDVPEKTDIENYLDGIELVLVGGESDKYARPLDYAWVLNIRDQCIRKNVSFEFRQCGTHFIKDGKKYKLQTKDLCNQARKAQIDYKIHERNL